MDRAVEVKDLSKVYISRKRGPTTAVDGVSFSVDPGEIVGLLGPNGAGKTTTIKSICTLIKPTSGSIHIDGVDAIRRPRSAVNKVAAVLEGNRNIYWRLTSKENLELFAGMQGIRASAVRTEITHLLEAFHLTDRTNAEARTLSRGMQQKLAVACALIKRTPVLLLDEPTLGLDVETSYELRASLKTMAGEGGRTILLSSHDMDVVQDVCERVIIINEGRIVSDDRVANLLEIFRVRAYKFTMAGTLPSLVQDDLVTRFPQARINADAHSTTLAVELSAGDQIYEVVEMLRACGAAIESIDRQDPNLEQIFLHILRTGSSQAPQLDPAQRTT